MDPDIYWEVEELYHLRSVLLLVEKMEVDIAKINDKQVYRIFTIFFQLP